MNHLTRQSQQHIWTTIGTHITERWRNKHNWVPPSEQELYKEKWRKYQEMPLRKLGEK